MIDKEKQCLLDYAVAAGNRDEIMYYVEAFMHYAWTQGATAELQFVTSGEDEPKNPYKSYD